MKKPEEFIQQLRTCGVAIWVEKNNLRCQGSAKVLTPDIIKTLQEMKLDLIKAIQEPPKLCSKCSCYETDSPDQRLIHWCVQKLHANSEWDYQHHSIDSLAECPHGYWN